ncbi:MAG: bifunctional DNA-formamidopyrimidine glycosylase/DNA-(apurinic or apyrimidinic site) lyase [Gammaproteobacteria bacterium PRO9]|nr:bifunctional DNA-formamidopyrimidine glycosylase/DNA-(apurinic or apyrimidinic site) lyase [Gammaproteobacteria bacterium PRO9]
MPELPEVETTRRGLAPWLEGRRLAQVVVRVPALRWPIPADFSRQLTGATVTALERRAKWLLLRTARGTGLLHLGMTGSFRVLREPQPPGRHDHLDLVTDAGVTTRFTDPRRFGTALWTVADPLQHPLLAPLGPEPLGAGFSGAYLHERCRRRGIAIKPLIMDAHVVVGVGNIYASEALFRAGIHPGRAAGRISASRADALAAAIREVLEEAIRAGGTTLRDFHDGDGRPGYFRQQLKVYDRAGLPCARCGTPIRKVVLGQRSSYYCPRCQR